jgi:IclR family mhp operon transcriptional activator
MSARWTNPGLKDAAMGKRIKQVRGGSVRSLERGLALLMAMNRRKLASVMELARDTQLPRPTVYRLLETLNRAGFVARANSTDRYRLARQVRALSDGFADDEWISEIAAPLMAEFTRKLVWPVALMTFDEGKMLVRETTHPASSLSIDYGMVGRRLPMLLTAAGRTYLAFAPDNERVAILDMLARSEAAEDRLAKDAARLSALFAKIRSQGHAIQDREINPRTGGIAVPIRFDDHILGSISVIWISSALTIEEAVQRFVEPLQSLANNIVETLRDSAVNVPAARAAIEQYSGITRG